MGTHVRVTAANRRLPWLMRRARATVIDTKKLTIVTRRMANRTACRLTMTTARTDTLAMTTAALS